MCNLCEFQTWRFWHIKAQSLISSVLVVKHLTGSKIKGSSLYIKLRLLSGSPKSFNSPYSAHTDSAWTNTFISLFLRLSVTTLLFIHLSHFLSYTAAKNCSYFKHFTSGEEAEVFEVKTQKGECLLITTQTTWHNKTKHNTLKIPLLNITEISDESWYKMYEKALSHKPKVLKQKQNEADLHPETECRVIIPQWSAKIT